ncbi:MAG: Eco57I restriction-modification methylase domain-containing protein, partial [Candidatus Entotheonellia bacterium]
MTFSTPRVRHYLREFALEKLFVEELGWDRSSGRLTVQVDGYTYTLHALAEKRGVQIFQCQPDAQGNIPDFAGRRKIEKQVTKSAYEHLLIYVDAAKTMQVWQWVARQPGQPAAYREHHYHPSHQSGDALIQKLEAITFLLSEEEGIDLA